MANHAHAERLGNLLFLTGGDILMIVFDKDHYMGVYIHSAVMHCRRTEKENLPTEQLILF